MKAHLRYRFSYCPTNTRNIIRTPTNQKIKKKIKKIKKKPKKNSKQTNTHHALTSPDTHCLINGMIFSSSVSSTKSIIRFLKF